MATVQRAVETESMDFWLKIEAGWQIVKQSLDGRYTLLEKQGRA